MHNTGPNAVPNLGVLSTTELVREALEETKELVRLEIKLAREEVRDDVVQLKTAAILLGIASVLGILTLASLVVALVLGLGGGVLEALLVAAALALICGILVAVAYRSIPKVPLERTRSRLKTNVNQLKEHII
jgi:putative superfamily III holin-X